MALVVALVAFVIIYLAPTLDIMRPGLEDEGDAIDSSLRVCRGQIPYRDFYFAVAPAGIYILSGWLTLFGSTLYACRAVTLAIAVASSLLLYHLGRRMMPAGLALLACLLFVSQSFPIWPVVSFHWLQLPFVLGAVAALERYDRSGGRAWILLSGALAGTAGFILQDGLIPALGLLVTRLTVRPLRQAGRECGALMGGMALGALPWLLLMLAKGNLGGFWNNCIIWVLTGYRPFNRGMTQPMPWLEIETGLATLSQLSPGELLGRWVEVTDFLTWPLALLVDYAMFAPLAFLGLALAWRTADPQSSAVRLYAVVSAACVAVLVARLGCDVVHVTFARHLWWPILVWTVGYLPWKRFSGRWRWLALTPGVILLAVFSRQLCSRYAELAQASFYVPFPKGTVRVADREYAVELLRLRRQVEQQAGPDGPVLIYPFPGLLQVLLGNPSPVPVTRLLPIYDPPDYFEQAFRAVEQQPTTVLLMRMDYPVYLRLYPAVPVAEFIRIDQEARARFERLAKGPVIRAVR